MALRTVLTIGNPILSQAATKLTTKEIQSDTTQALITDMIDTMRHHQGVGIAAPQVGILKRIFIMEVKDSKRYPNNPNFPLTVVINPSITRVGNQNITGTEGCLSVPDRREEVTRSNSILLSFTDRFGNPTTLNLQQFPAIIAQHELDHLNGTLFLDRL